MYRYKLIFLGLLIAAAIISLTISSGNFEENDQVLENKIAQMLLIGFRGTQIDENSHIYKVLMDINVGGVILFDYDVPSQSYPRNIVSPEQTKKLTIVLRFILKRRLNQSTKNRQEIPNPIANKLKNKEFCNIVK